MNDFHKSKFRLSETFNNSNGKTSGSAFIGVILGLVSAITWIVLPVLIILFNVIDSDIAIEIMKQTINLVWASVALLGARKVAGSFGTSKNNDDASQC